MSWKVLILEWIPWGVIPNNQLQGPSQALLEDGLRIFPTLYSCFTYIPGWQTGGFCDFMGFYWVIWHNHMSHLHVSSFLWMPRKWKSRFKSWESGVPYFALRWMSPLSKVCGTSLRNWKWPTNINETGILSFKKVIKFHQERQV